MLHVDIDVLRRAALTVKTESKESMRTRICLECQEKKGAQITLHDFPIEDFHWCSDKCLFIWICKHDLRYDGELCHSLEKRKTKEIVNMNDVIELNDLKQS